MDIKATKVTLQQADGRPIKSWAMTGGELIGPQNHAQLLYMIGWSLAARSKLREAAWQVPYQWLDENDNVIADEELPFKWGFPEPAGIPQDEQTFDTAQVLARVLESGLAPYSQAGLYKYVNEPGDLLTLTWLDPSVLIPDRQGDLPLGQTPRMWTHGSNAVKQQRLHIEDFIWIRDKGVSTNARHLRTPAASGAQLAAAVATQLDTVSVGVLDDPLPVLAIEYPPGTQKAQHDMANEQISGIINMIRYRASRFGQSIAAATRKIVGIPQGSKVETISFSPDAISTFNAIIPEKRKEVASLYGVPDSVLTGENSAVTGVSVHYTGFLHSVAARCEMIAKQINSDPAIQALGLRLVVDHAQLPRPLEETTGRANMFSAFMNQGVHPVIAAGWAGLPIPEGMEDEFVNLALASQQSLVQWRSTLTGVNLVTSFELAGIELTPEQQRAIAADQEKKDERAEAQGQDTPFLMSAATRAYSTSSSLDQPLTPSDAINESLSKLLDDLNGSS